MATKDQRSKQKMTIRKIRRKKLAGEAAAGRLRQRPSAATQEEDLPSADDNTELDNHYITPLQDGYSTTPPDRRLQRHPATDGRLQHHTATEGRRGDNTAAAP